MLVGDAILHVEVANKEVGSLIQKWEAPGVKSKSTSVPEGVDPMEAWTYLHAIDKRTGKVLWRGTAGTSPLEPPSTGSW